MNIKILKSDVTNISYVYINFVRCCNKTQLCDSYNKDSKCSECGNHFYKDVPVRLRDGAVSRGNGTVMCCDNKAVSLNDPLDKSPYAICQKCYKSYVVIVDKTTKTNTNTLDSGQ